jgi:uncharacterized membrane protein (DUF2068 family)
MHPQVRDPKHVRGVRTVATIEFTKGALVVLAGLGIFTVRHRDIWGVAETFLEFIHANPHHHLVGVFINLVYRIHDVRLWKIALAAGIYVLLRFVEAYGLWYTLPWAEWLAFASGAIYIPFEVADLIRRPTRFALLVLVVNLVIVLYMLFLRLEAARKRMESSVHRHAES